MEFWEVAAGLLLHASLIIFCALKLYHLVFTDCDPRPMSPLHDSDADDQDSPPLAQLCPRKRTRVKSSP